MKKLDLTNISEAGESKRISAGAYICKFVGVEDIPEKEYLKIDFDVTDGEFKDYFKESAERLGSWPYGGSYRRSYKPTALPFFKRMCSAISKSNGNFVFDGGQVNADEKTLIGKRVGIILGEEEYIGNDGNVKVRTYVYSEKSVDDILKGNFKVPDLKKLPDEDIPEYKPEVTENTSNSSGLPF